MGHDPLLHGRRENSGDPNAAFHGEQSQGSMGNHAGPMLAIYRLVRWICLRLARR